MSGVLVLGASGHGKVVVDILLCQGVEVRGFLDDDPTTWGKTCLGLPVLGSIELYADYHPEGLALGIGDNEARRRVVQRLGSRAEGLWCDAIHPRATVATSVQLGQGVVIACAAVVNPDSAIGNYVIINTAATIDHDCAIGDYAHLAPGAHLSGGVRVGEGTLIGVGGVVAPGKAVGAWCVVGAGGVVVRDTPDRVIAKGVPARW